MRIFLFLLLCAVCLAQTKPASDDSFADAGLTAYDSIYSMSLKVHGSEEAFQPRQIDAEKALNAAERKAKTDQDKKQLAILRAWSDLVGRHRDLMGQGYREAGSLVTSIYGAEFKCLTEAKAIFKLHADKPDNSAPTRDMEGKWADVPCVQASKSAIAETY